MEFISFPFVGLLVCAFILYYLRINQIWQKSILLLASVTFISYYHISYLLVALLISFFTYAAGHFLYKKRNTRWSPYILWGSIIILVVGWLAFRYCASLFPLGISFYTFQALSYLIEIYWEDEEPEHDLWDFVLYMLLFMKFLSGPIERGYDLLPQLKKIHSFDYEHVTYGMKFLLVGAFMKLVIADRIGPYLDNIFNAVQGASGIQLFESMLLYPIQLYTDFAGYTNMAIGIGMMFGFKLSPNFNRPFVSLTTSELWRRWHMSLSFWVRDYIFVPLTASTRKWKSWGIYFSLLITFVSLGIWHGAGWTFAIYGLIQGIIIIYETAAEKQRNYLHKIIGDKLFNTISIVRTYFLFAFSLLFFRIEKMSDVYYTLSHMFRWHFSSWKAMNMNMRDKEWIIFGIAVILFGIYEYYNSKKDLIKLVSEQHVVVRWSIYYVFLLAIFAFGVFGMKNFIYIQF